MRGDFSSAGDRGAHENFRFGRSGLSLFYRADALGYSGGDGGDKRRTKRRDSGSEDSGGFGCGASGAVEEIFGKPETERAGEGRKAAGGRLQDVSESVER